nr:hypothetical protein [Tanacetum cinerariifolium]
MVKDVEAHFDMTMRQKAVFECLSAPHAQDFLLAISIDGVGQHMSPVEYRTILKYRLMIPLFSIDAICPVCHKACLDSFGEHAVHFKELPRFKYRHDMVRDILFDIWLSSKGFTAGQAALKAASDKVTKHEKAYNENQHVFIPFAFDNFGFLTPEAVELLSRVQRVMHSNVLTPRSTDVVFKRIGFAIQKRLAAQLVARLPLTTMPEVHCDNIVQAQRPGIAGLKFRYLSVLYSLSAVALFFCDVPCIGRKSVSRDAVPKSSEFNAEHYATLVAYPALFHKYPEPFLCLIGMSHLLSFIRNADLTKVRIGEREHDEDEPKLLETTIGRVVSLLLVAPDRSSGELEASVDKLFNEGGKAVVEDVAPAELQRKKKQKTKVVDAGKPSHPAKKIKGGRVMPTFSFVSSSVSTTPKYEGGDHAELLAGANLHTLKAPQRFVISSDSSDHSGANIVEAEVDSIVRTFVPIMTSATAATPTADPAATVNERLIGSSVFGGDFASAGGSHPISGGFSDCTGSDFLVGGIRTVVDPDSNLQRVYVPQWNVTNGFCMDDGGVSCEMVDEFAPLIFLRPFEKRRLKSMLEEKDVLLKSRCDEIESLKAQLIVKEAEAAEAVRLCDEAQTLKEHNINLEKEKTQTLKEHNINLEKEKSELEVKVTDLAASVKVMKQEVADLDAVVTSVKLQNDSIADQSVNFPLIAELKTNKDASVEVIMNLFRPEDALAEKLVLKVGMPISAGITASAPYVNENDVSPLLDLIMAIGLGMFNGGEALADT